MLPKGRKFEKIMRMSKNKTRWNVPNLTLRAGLAARWLVVLLGLAALGSQSFLVRPHFHAQDVDTPQAVAQVQLSANTALAQHTADDLTDETNPGTSKQEDIPADTDIFDCSMCQSAHQNGHMLKPAAEIASLTTGFYSRSIEHFWEFTAKSAISFNWQTRAPPQA